MELQFRWVNRVLELYPDVSYQVWSMARDSADKTWLASLPSSRRSMIRYDYADLKRAPAYRAVWRRYADDPSYKDTVFVKVDDDVVFLDPDRFRLLVDAARQHPDTIVSADVINNGACNTLHPELDGCHLNTHQDNACAEQAHSWFLQNWPELLNSPVKLHPAPFWVSINAVAMTWPTLRALTRQLKKPCPPTIAGYTHTRATFGDEGAANMLPRLILSGVMAAHLTFEPQEATVEQCDRWRLGYADMAAQLARPVPHG